MHIFSKPSTRERGTRINTNVTKENPQKGVDAAACSKITNKRIIKARRTQPLPKKYQTPLPHPNATLFQQQRPTKKTQKCRGKKTRFFKSLEGFHVVNPHRSSSHANQPTSSALGYPKPSVSRRRCKPTGKKAKPPRPS